MPLADHRRRVSGSLHQLGESLLRSIEAVAVHQESIEMAVLARENHRPARPADGVGDVAIVEPHPFMGETVDIWCLVDPRAVGADRLIGVIVGEDEENVRPRPQRECLKSIIHHLQSRMEKRINFMLLASDSWSPNGRFFDYIFCPFFYIRC